MFTKNKLWVISVLMVIALTLAGCSSDSQELPDPTPEDMETQIDDDSQVDMEFSDDIGDSVALPAGYPQDLFPIYGESYIFGVVELEGGYTITAFSKDDFQDVAAFYKNVLEGTVVTYESDRADGYTSFGTIGEYTYNFDTGASVELEGYITSIVIMLMPN
ncbi:MAG TPA: hypothetical protein DF480_03960 [Clostridiales bacterium]|nr:hypothetical protein [Clostridiales bacterium]